MSKVRNPTPYGRPLKTRVVSVLLLVCLSACSPDEMASDYERLFVPGPVQVFGHGDAIRVLLQFDQVFVPAGEDSAWDYPTVRKVGHRQWDVGFSLSTGKFTACELEYGKGYGISFNPHVAHILFRENRCLIWVGPSYDNYSTVYVFSDDSCSFRMLGNDIESYGVGDIADVSNYGDGLRRVREMQKESDAVTLYVGENIDDSVFEYKGHKFSMDVTEGEFGFSIVLEANEFPEGRIEIQVPNQRKKFSKHEIDQMPRPEIGRRKR